VKKKKRDESEKDTKSSKSKFSPLSLRPSPLTKLEFKRTDLKALPKKERSEYLSLIIPDAHLFFDKALIKTGNIVAVEARIDQKLVGLAVARIVNDTNHCELVSIMVAESHRRQGIGKALFGQMRNILAKEKWGFLRLFYNKSTPSGEALTKIMAAYGWAPPTLHVIRFHFDAYAFDADWLYNLDPFPPEIHLFPWKKRSVQDVFWIEYLGSQGRFLPTVNPDNNSSLIDYPTSIGMRHNEKLIGWSITHRIDPNTIRYSSLFIDHFFKHTTYGIRLLIESIKLHKELPVPRAIFEVNFQEMDRTWGLFIKKRLMPLSDKIEKIHQAIGSLEDKNG
jgi:GNAT superfamily N-acetyltransferase